MDNSIFYIIFSILCAVALALIAWCALPDATQKSILKWLRTHLFPRLLKWLKVKVDEAEKELGSGTGELKLRMVYDAFAARYKWLSIVMPFSLFSALVDDALEALSEELDKVR